MTNNCDQILDLRLLISLFHLYTFWTLMTEVGIYSPEFIHLSSSSHLPLTLPSLDSPRLIPSKEVRSSEGREETSHC